MESIYKILCNEIYGRYGVANRDIKQGELILKERPLIISPPLGAKPICFKCCTVVSKKYLQVCEKCKTAFICGPNCSGVFHTNQECDQLTKLEVDFSLLKNYEEIIPILRILLVRYYSAGLWKELNELESHVEARRNTPIWKTHQILVEDILKDTKLISEKDIENETIQKICGILDVNTFEIRAPPSMSILNSKCQNLRGLYLNAALMAHNCISNTHLAVDDDFMLYIYASVDIQKDTPIFLNYANAMQGTLERKNHLREGKYFECFCTRCLDPSELGTHISSLKCHKCLKGKLQFENLTWTCTFCGKSFNRLLIENTLRQVRYLMEDTDPTSIMELEKLHGRLLQTLHPQHYMMLELQQNLIGLYSQSVPSRENLTRKIDLCQNLLKVIQVLEPGISRVQGLTLNELHSSIANLAYLEYSKREISLEILLQRLKLSEDILKAALKHLLYEPKKSPEGSLAQNALRHLKILRESINDVEIELKQQNSKSKRKMKNKNTDY
ncbi:hypothetical protein HHI36_015371 [Cryptolaemus montrouzieri]|uniref:SET domain-containing protein n=1 Tax=Cryptolaemus montrouzieri TaxID=559131 RepID=A0ABD2N5I2_9CUCU